MKFTYSFPASKRAKERTLNEQVAILREEAVEVYRACMDWDEGKMLAAVMGVVFAAEGVLRKYPKNQIEAAYEFTGTWAQNMGEFDKGGEL